VIHRDIKPENILLQGGHALVADFGIALAVQSAGGAGMTQTGLSLGTPQYMSPEQAMGERTIDARSDIYALGAVTYEMLAGEPPFTGPSVQAIVAKVMTERPPPHVLRDTIPPSVEHAVLTALAKLPADRFTTAAEFGIALRSDATHATMPSAIRSTPIAWPRTMIALGATGVVLLGVALWALTRSALAQSRMFDAALPDSALMSSAPDVASAGYGAPVLNLAVAATGDFVVYPVRHGDSTMLWYRSLIDASAHPITGTAGGTMPRLSPDASELAFVSANRVLVMPVSGGEQKRLLQADAPPTLDWVSPTRLFAIANDGVTLHWLDAETGASDASGMTITLKSRRYYGSWVGSQNRLLCGQGEGVFEDI
jgi:serine/threonine-protein kinase